jgi:hypothetical protein
LTIAIQKFPRHWSTCREDLVCGAATNSDGHDAVNACAYRVRCRKSCAKYRGMRSEPKTLGNLSGAAQS